MSFHADAFVGLPEVTQRFFIKVVILVPPDWTHKSDQTWLNSLKQIAADAVANEVKKADPSIKDADIGVETKVTIADLLTKYEIYPKAVLSVPDRFALANNPKWRHMASDALADALVAAIQGKETILDDDVRVHGYVDETETERKIRLGS